MLVGVVVGVGVVLWCSCVCVLIVFRLCPVRVVAMFYSYFLNLTIRWRCGSFHWRTLGPCTITDWSTQVCAPPPHFFP